MSDTTGREAAGTIVRLLAETYRSQGFHQVAVPIPALLGVAGSRQALEEALGSLLDDGSVVPVPGVGIALHPNARTALLGRAVLQSWHDKVSRRVGPAEAVYRDAIAEELATLVRSATGADLPADLTQRAAELAAVLATTDLDPAAMDAVGALGGTPRSRLVALAALPPRTLAVEQVRNHLRNAVSTRYPGG